MSDPPAYREALYSAFTGVTTDPEDAISDGLDIGREYLGVSLGFLTRIEDDTQEIVQSVGDHPLLVPGASCPLDRAYCKRTIEVDGTLSVQSVESTDAIPQAAVDTFGLDTYIGSKVVVDGDLYGTVCFADTDGRDGAFSEAEELFVELLAKLIGQAFERRSYTERLQRRNDRLRAEKRRFESIAESSFDVIFRIDDDAELTYVSTAVERALGYRPDDIVGRPFTDLLAESSVGDAATAYASVLDGSPVEGVGLTFVTADGDSRTFEVNAAPITDAGDTAASVQGVARDVTDRRERQRELQTKTRAMDEADIGIVLADATRPDNPITYVNEGFTELSGYSREDIIGSNCRLLQGANTDPETVATLRRAIDAEEPVSVEIVNYRADGTAFWNEVSVTPIEDDSGTVTRYLGFQRDVTDRKRREQLIDVMNRVLRHNLRNKMTVIRRNVAEGDTAGSVDATVEAATADLLTVADKARSLYTISKADPDPTRLEVGPCVRDAVETVRTQRDDVAVTVDIRTDRNICAGPKLDTALDELLRNAVEHNGAPEKTVSVTARDDGEEVVLTVTDDGPGISETEAEVINAGRETKLKHGMGLGLWLVNWIVTWYGGSFQVSRREDTGEGGTVATVRLPGIAADEAVEDAARVPTILAT